MPMSDFVRKCPTLTDAIAALTNQILRKLPIPRPNATPDGPKWPKLAHFSRAQLRHSVTPTLPRHRLPPQDSALSTQDCLAPTLRLVAPSPCRPVSFLPPPSPHQIFKTKPLLSHHRLPPAPHSLPSELGNRRCWAWGAGIVRYRHGCLGSRAGGSVSSACAQSHGRAGCAAPGSAPGHYFSPAQAGTLRTHAFPEGVCNQGEVDQNTLSQEADRRLRYQRK